MWSPNIGVQTNNVFEYEITKISTNDSTFNVGDKYYTLTITNSTIDQNDMVEVEIQWYDLRVENCKIDLSKFGQSTIVFTNWDYWKQIVDFYVENGNDSQVYYRIEDDYSFGWRVVKTELSENRIYDSSQEILYNKHLGVIDRSSIQIFCKLPCNKTTEYVFVFERINAYFHRENVPSWNILFTASILIIVAVPIRRNFRKNYEI